MMNRFAQNDERRVDMEATAQKRRDEGHFKIEAQLPEIHATDAAETIKSLEKFEKVLSDSGIKTRSVWVRFFRCLLYTSDAADE